MSSQGQHLCKENMVTEVTAHICPEIAADQELIWEIVDDAGIPLKIAEVQSEGRKALITAKVTETFGFDVCRKVVLKSKDYFCLGICS